MSDSIWRVPRTLVRDGAPLLDQQCFCFGEDVKRTDGNLLLEFGFVRERHASEKKVASRYVRPDDAGGLWTLWAFGLFRGVPGAGGMLLSRTAFTARLMENDASPDIWTRRDAVVRYPATPADGDALRVLLGETLRFLAEYETWVMATCGAPWRARCVARWHKTRLPATTMADDWRRLAQLCDAPR